MRGLEPRSRSNDPFGSISARTPSSGQRTAGTSTARSSLLRVLRASGVKRFVELNTRPSESRRAIDVVALDEARKVMLLIQVWNTFGDLGSAARGFDRELAAAAEAAAGLGYPNVRVAGCWAIVDSRRNRDLLRRYPEFFATRFPGSSVGWLSAIARREPPPEEPGHRLARPTPR